jgi:hypothetical protein
VGRFSSSKGEFVVAVNFTDERPLHEENYPGAIAREMAKEVAAKLGVW